MHTIVLATDGSPGALAATTWAATEAKLQHADVVVVHVRTGSWELDALQIGADRVDQLTSDLLAGPWTAPLRDAGVDFRVENPEGKPADEIAAVADEVGAELVVIGHTGHSGLGEHVLGSTTHRLLIGPHWPVAVVPVPEKVS